MVFWAPGTFVFIDNQVGVLRAPVTTTSAKAMQLVPRFDERQQQDP